MSKEEQPDDLMDALFTDCFKCMLLPTKEAKAELLSRGYDHDWVDFLCNNVATEHKEEMVYLKDGPLRDVLK
jgi:hypothetical protein